MLHVDVPTWFLAEVFPKKYTFEPPDVIVNYTIGKEDTKQEPAHLFLHTDNKIFISKRIQTNSAESGNS